MVGGNNYPMFLEQPPKWLKALWDRQTFQGYKSIPSLSVIEFKSPVQEISPYLIWGCNFGIRKDVLLKAGGFHPDGMPRELIRFRGDGETNVSRYVAKSGMKCLFHPGSSVHHKIPSECMTYTYLRQRGFNQGVSDSYTMLRQRGKRTANFSMRNQTRRVLNYAIHNIMSLIDSAEVKIAFKELELGHKEGYLFHQAAYKVDLEVREWVHRPTYY
jgi:hypothetical protein